MAPAASAMTKTVNAAAGGDEHAWNQLVERFTPMLRGVVRAYRLGPQDTDDVIQMCWISLLENLHSLREPDAIGGWLVTTARRNAFRVLQRELREVPATDPLCAALPSADCVESIVLDRERALLLREAVQRLPGRQRTLLEAFLHGPDPSYGAISFRLGMPLGSIGPTRERGLGRLRRDPQLAQAVAC